MKVTVQLFAAARDVLGQNQVPIELSSGATVGMLRRKLAEKHPSLEPFLKQSLFAVNAQYANESTALEENCEVACIPPVSGG